MDAYDAMMETLAAGTSDRLQSAGAAGWRADGSSVHDTTGSAAHDWSGQSSYTPTEDDADRVAAEMLDSHRTQSNAAAFDEVQFTDYLLGLEQELEDAELEAQLSEEEMGDAFLKMVSNEVDCKNILAQSPYAPLPVETVSEKQPAEAEAKASEPPQFATPADEPATPLSELSEEERQDEFLRMVSNEVEYKKLLGQSPYAITDIEVPVLLQRFLDNLEDGTQKNNGKFKGQSRLKRQKSPKEERKTVVVVSDCLFIALS